MTNLDKIIDELMNLRSEQRRNEIAQDAKLSLAEFKAGKLKIQTATEAISELREFI